MNSKSQQESIGLVQEISQAMKQRRFVFAFIYFYCLLFAYYLLRPIREEVGILHGVDNLQWLYSGTFVIMLLLVPVFGFCKNLFRRRHLTIGVYGFFTVNLLLFYVWFGADSVSPWLARTFFIWLSVFNMFAVSVFWSVMADIYDPSEAVTLFAPISAAGSLGGITGSWITARFVEQLGLNNLMLGAALLLSVVMICAAILLKDRSQIIEIQPDTTPAKGGIFHGVSALKYSNYLRSIALIAVLYTIVASLLYFIQAQLVGEYLSDSVQRTRFFAQINFAINFCALIFQFFFTSTLVRRYGVSRTYGGVLGVIMLCVLALGIWPALITIAVTQIIFRSGQFGAMKPCYDMLFSVVTQEQKYKSKNFIDTSLVRSGDLIGAWSFTALKATGMTILGITLTTAMLVIGLAVIAIRTGLRFDQAKGQQITGIASESDQFQRSG